MGIRTPRGLRIINSALEDPAATARALRPILTTHPVPQSDPRTRGLLIETDGRAPGIARVVNLCTPLGAAFARFVVNPDAAYLVAVNETPPGPPDHFLMRPHLDRLWRPDGFSGGPPVRTTVAFIDFPPGGTGGELVVFPRTAFANGVTVPRDDAGRTVTAHGGKLIAPVPGRACVLAGDLPHAVLGYTASPAGPNDNIWRLSMVVAEFAPQGR